MEIEYSKERDILKIDGQEYSGHYVKMTLDPGLIGNTYRVVKNHDGVIGKTIVNPTGVLKCWKAVSVMEWWFVFLGIISAIWGTSGMVMFFLTLSVVYAAARLIITAIGEASDNVISELSKIQKK